MSRRSEAKKCVVPIATASMALGLNMIEANNSEECIFLDVEVQTPQGKRMLHALLDSGAQGNFISQAIVLEERIPFEKTSARVNGVGGQGVSVYGAGTLETHARDMRGIQRWSDHPFYAVNLQGFELILGMPWLKKMNPDISWTEREWFYRNARAAIGTDSAEKFVEQDEIMHMGMILVKPMDSMRDAGVSVANMNIEEPVLPEEYRDFADVFEENEDEHLPQVSSVRHSIETEEGKPVPYGPLYPLSQLELRTLREYLEDSLRKGWIQESTSPAGAPILFVKKKDGSLRLCVDYRGLNKITKKNRYPLPLIGEILDRLADACYFTQLDLRNAYHRIWIKKEDRWKTAFRTRYGHYEYCVMPFGLTNAPATFQAFVNETLVGLLDNSCIAFMDDILIFSQSREEHTTHTREVLTRLRKSRLYVKLSKCRFSVQEVDFLGYRIGIAGVSMDPRKVATIAEWEEPKSFREIQVFLGFANFYRRFIFRYSAITAPMTNLLKGMEKGKKKGTFVWTAAASHAFRKLKACFVEGTVLQHYDPQKPCRIETDSSGYGIAGILSQPCETEASRKRFVWKPVAFFSRKMSGTECNYGVPDQELLAIVESCKEWRHYLEWSQQRNQVITDHLNLRYFYTLSQVNRRQARWAEQLAAYDLEIVYRPGSQNPADAPSRRPDYKGPGDIDEAGPSLSQILIAGEERAIQRRGLDERMDEDVSINVLTRAQRESGTELGAQQRESGEAASQGSRKRRSRLAPKAHASHPQEVIPIVNPRQEARIATEEMSPYGKVPDALTSHLLSLQSRDAWCSQAIWKRSPHGIVEKGDMKGKWHEDHASLMRCDGAIYVPNDPATRAEILRQNHDDPWLGGHFGVEKTLDSIRRLYHWPSLASSVRDYCATCDICQRMKAPRHKPYGLLAPLPQPQEPWQDIAMDFITGLPYSLHQRRACDAILNVVCRYSKETVHIPTTVDISASELAELLEGVVFAQHGVPRSIVSDRGTLFTSEWWTTFCHHLVIKQRLSTAFHPQTDGVTERQNQTLECYLRCYVNYHQDNWASLLPAAQFAYNNSVHSATGKRPTEMTRKYVPTIRRRVAGDPPLERGENQDARQRAENLQDSEEEARELWRQASESAAKYYNNKHKERTYAVGDNVMLSSRHIRLRRASKKLADKFLGPFPITKKFGKNAYQLRLPKTYGRIHPTFHVSLLEPYRERVGRELPEPIEIDNEEEWEVERVLDVKESQSSRMFLVRWKGCTAEEDSWQPEEDLAHAQEAIQDFYKDRQDAPKPHAKRRRGRKTKSAVIEDA
jgi:Reverse transcriptase (RNA-dependent DNA polymerase)/RNase H-like domain found in reverse transcriptase/Integrase zinc binding domain/Chromo (CHRromatin Organisation MOdifier) domain/Integrase core domain